MWAWYLEIITPFSRFVWPILFPVTWGIIICYLPAFSYYFINYFFYLCTMELLGPVTFISPVYQNS